MHTNLEKNSIRLHPVELADCEIELHIKSTRIKFGRIFHGKVISDCGVKVPSQLSAATEEIEHIANLDP